MLAAPEHKEMNGQVGVTLRTLHTITHSIMVHDRVLEAYIHFALMYTTDHIFLGYTNQRSDKRRRQADHAV